MTASTLGGPAEYLSLQLEPAYEKLLVWSLLLYAGYFEYPKSS